MTLQTSDELEELGKELHKQFRAYWGLWYDILFEMEWENATQEECDIEREEEGHINMERRKAVAVIETKLREWGAIKEKEKLDDLHRRERLKWDEEDKSDKD
jgi:hypothetical protein